MPIEGSEEDVIQRIISSKERAAGLFKGTRIPHHVRYGIEKSLSDLLSDLYLARIDGVATIERRERALGSHNVRVAQQLEPTLKPVQLRAILNEHGKIVKQFEIFLDRRANKT